MKLNQAMKAFLHEMMPPAVGKVIALARGGERCVWSGDYPSWAEAVADSTGYDSDVIVARVTSAALEVKRGDAVYERDGVLFDEIEYSWQMLSGLMWVAARNGGRLDVVDFGGALGTSFYQNRHFLAPLAHVRWNVVEQPCFVEVGRRLFADDERLRFHLDFDSCAIVDGEALLLSSVLQYLEQPCAIVAAAARRCRYLLLDLTPVHDGLTDRLTVQTVPPTICPARYPCWLFSEAKLLSQLEAAFEVVAAFDSHFSPDIRAGATRARYRGYILERR
jgi:putative methyltransferase (TIGR04325 family)